MSRSTWGYELSIGGVGIGQAHTVVFRSRHHDPNQAIAHLFDTLTPVEHGAVIQAYQFALDPAPEQDAALRSHCGAQRYAYNWGLARITANLAQREAERSYGIPEAEMTSPVNWSAFSLRKQWNQAKDMVAPWWSENSKEAYSSGLANLATALGNWSDSHAGRRRGPRVRFPRFKGKRTAMSCRFTTGAFGLANDRRRQVPRQAHQDRPLRALAGDACSYRETARLRRKRQARRVAQAVDPSGADLRHDRGGRPQCRRHDQKPSAGASHRRGRHS